MWFSLSEISVCIMGIDLGGVTFQHSIALDPLWVDFYPLNFQQASR